MTLRRIALVAVAACSLTVGVARAADSVCVERIVAVVNNDIILLSDLKERAAQMGQQIDDSGPDEARRRAEKVLRPVLDRMVDEMLVNQEAVELKLSVDDADVDRAVEEVKQQNHLDEKQFIEALQGQGLTLSGYRKDLRKQLLRFKVINTAVRAHVNITEEDMRAFYDQTTRHAGSHEQAHVRHILVAVPERAGARVLEDARKKAADIVAEARGGTKFEDLAKKYSDDAGSRDDGGDLGWVKEGDSLPESLSEIIFASDPSDVRGPVRTERGFEIVQVVEKKDSDVRPYAEVKDQIRQQLYSQQLEKQTQTWLAELRKKAHIDVRL